MIYIVQRKVTLEEIDNGNVDNVQTKKSLLLDAMSIALDKESNLIYDFANNKLNYSFKRVSWIDTETGKMKGLTLSVELNTN